MVGTGANGLLGIVEVNNILSPLPTGTNTIGGVVVTSIDVPLPTGNNKIGRVDIDTPIEVNPVIVEAIMEPITIEALPQDSAKSQKVTAATPGIVTVKNSPGLVYSVASDGTVQLLDGEREAWAPGNFQFPVPLSCDSSIKLRFTEPGDAFILFK
ncbi:TPA: hypothetical protein N6134_005032 [Escherichia coli]|nr:hypothetical protein [Escherichia coli]